MWLILLPFLVNMTPQELRDLVVPIGATPENDGPPPMELGRTTWTFTIGTAGRLIVSPSSPPRDPFRCGDQGCF